LIHQLNNKTMTTAQEIFKGISTAELVSYRLAGDNSKELAQEITRRALTMPKRNSNLKSDAQYNGKKTKL
jgi:hypothetical protein